MQEMIGRAFTRRDFVKTTSAGLAVLPLASAVASAGETAGNYSMSDPAKSGDIIVAAPDAIGRPMPVDAKLGDPQSNRIGIAIVGLGNYALGQIMPRIAHTKHLRLAAIVSGNRDKARAVAASYGLAEKNIYSYETFDRLRDDTSVDALHIILPPALHAEWAIRGAKIGKHVLCEKPMAPTSAECRQMIDAFNAADRRLMIGYRAHWEPHNVEAQRLLRAGEIGTVRQIVGEHGTLADPATPHGEWRIQKALAGGGSLFDVGIYSLNGSRFLSGEEPTEVRAAFRRPPGSLHRGKVADVELGLSWTALFPSGLRATATSSYDHNVNRMQVTGDDGSLDLSPATSYVGDILRIKKEEGERMPKVAESEEQFTGMMDEFATAVREKREPKTSGAEGLKDIRLMELIYEAAGNGRAMPVPKM